MLDQLAASGARVRALNRRAEPAPLPPGIEVASGHLTRPDTLVPALEGVDAVFLVWTAPPAAVEPALARDRDPRTARRAADVAATSTAHPLFQQPNPLRGLHARIEAGSRRPGPGGRSCAPACSRSTRCRGGVVRSAPAPSCAGRTSTADGADPRARHRDGGGACPQRGRPRRRRVVLTGPQSLTQAEQITAIGEAIGRPLRAVNLTGRGATRTGAPVPARGRQHAAGCVGRGGGSAGLHDLDRRALSGAPARPYREWAEDHAADFRDATPAA